jgi:uncharacterized protein YcnI
MSRLTKHMIAAVTAAAFLIVAPAVQAHVTLQPDSAAAGGFTRLDVRVPNEQDNASTTKVEVQFPPGFVFVSYQPVQGWNVRVVKEKLDKPIEAEGEKINEQVARVVWTGSGEQGKIGPGQFMDFPLSVQIPDKAGQKLTFKALQTYDNGDVVRWIGPPDSEEPAPQVTVTAAEEEGGAHGAAEETAAKTEETSASSSNDDNDASKGLGIAALVVGGLGLVVGGAAFARARGGR